MIFGTSDTHINHLNIIRYCNRPFHTLKEMNDTIIKNTNNIVSPDDILIHCGDFAFGCDSSILNYRKRINCKNIYLVLGNHDREIKEHRAKFAVHFNIVDYLSCTIDNKKCIFNHYPLEIERNQTKKKAIKNIVYYNGLNSYFYHGHTHSYEPGNLGVDSHNFTPVYLGESFG
jgi:calcineurin-like phosphoesterase family protein